MCHHYGPTQYFDAYYADLALEAEVRGTGTRQPIEERAEMIVLPRIAGAIAGASVFLSALVILIHVVG